MQSITYTPLWLFFSCRHLMSVYGVQLGVLSSWEAEKTSHLKAQDKIESFFGEIEGFLYRPQNRMRAFLHRPQNWVRVFSQRRNLMAFVVRTFLLRDFQVRPFLLDPSI